MKLLNLNNVKTWTMSSNEKHMMELSRDDTMGLENIYSENVNNKHSPNIKIEDIDKETNENDLLKLNGDELSKIN